MTKLSERMRELVSDNPFASLADAMFINAVAAWSSEVAELEAEVERLRARAGMTPLRMMALASWLENGTMPLSDIVDELRRCSRAKYGDW